MTTLDYFYNEYLLPAADTALQVFCVIASAVLFSVILVTVPLWIAPYLISKKERKKKMFVDIFNTEKRYSVIYADPPWKQSKGGKKSVREKSSGKALDYPVCSLEEIQNHLTQAVSLTEDNSILFLWTIDKYLFEAQKMAEALGYKLHSRMIWDKVTGIPAAFTVRYGHEYLLYMYKGKFTPVATEERGKIHTVFRERVKRHSQKPQIAYEIIERLYPKISKIELYARNHRDGWDCWGNEV